MTKPVKKSQETRYNFDPESFFVSCFWGRQPDGVAINETLKVGFILEFKRSTDRGKGFLEVKDAEANEHHKSIIGALKAAATGWKFEQINFVVGNRGSVVQPHKHSLTRALSLSPTYKHSVSFTHSHTHTLNSLSHTYTHTHAHTQSLSQPSHPPSPSPLLCVSLCHSHLRACARSLSLSLSFTHTHLHTHAHEHSH